MKVFRCAKCQHPHRFDETKLNAAQVRIACVKCGSQNIVNLGPVLVVQSEASKVQVPLKLGENTVGRKTTDKAIDIPIIDKYVSRVHANILVEKKEGKLYISIEDRGSLNGTFDRNKKKIKPNLKYPFVSGDSFIIGLTKLTLKY